MKRTSATSVRRVAAIAGIVILILFAATVADARVGGGESYSGGGGSGGGGGGGGDGELVWLAFRLLLWLTIEHPVIGIPVDVIVIVVVIRYAKRNRKLQVLRVSAASQRRAAPAARLDALRRFDPNFSEITFADFGLSLYARTHEARGRGDLDRYAPYLSMRARSTLRRNNPKGLTEVRGIVIGSFRVGGVHGLDKPTVYATVVYESNYTEVVGRAQTSWYAKEQWVLQRKRDILSAPPEKAKADHCPRCGAALQTRTDGACDYCGVKVENGAFQWYVESITLLSREARGPLLTSNVPEQGTDRPTIYQPRFGEHRAAFENAHGGFDWTAFTQRVHQTAVALQDAWSGMNWERARPLETEGLFQTHRYWMDAYAAQGLQNRVDDFRVLRIEPAKIVVDAFYEAVTARIWAEGRDSTVDAAGRVVAGSKSELRCWSEYWTFIRTRSAREGETVSCPNCGAEVAAGSTGICSYCGGKLTMETFDWVLSRIEQDEAYTN